MRVKAMGIALGVIFLAFFLFVALLDYLAAATLFPTALAVAAALGLLVGGLFLMAGDRRVVLILTACYLVALVALRLTVLSPVKPFRAFYGAIEPGMTKAAVLNELDRHFPLPGRFVRPTAGGSDSESMWLALDLNDGRYNSELVRVDFSEGLAVGKQYLPD